MQQFYIFHNAAEMEGPIDRPRSDKWRSISANTPDAELLAYDVHGDGSLDVSIRPQVAVGQDLAVDPLTEVKEQTSHVVTATEVTDTWTVRAMTQPELDAIEADEDGRADDAMNRAEAKMMYHIIHGSVPAPVQNEVPPATANFKQWYRTLKG